MKQAFVALVLAWLAFAASANPALEAAASEYKQSANAARFACMAARTSDRLAAEAQQMGRPDLAPASGITLGQCLDKSAKRLQADQAVVAASVRRSNLALWRQVHVATVTHLRGMARGAGETPADHAQREARLEDQLNAAWVAFETAK